MGLKVPAVRAANPGAPSAPGPESRTKVAGGTPVVGEDHPPRPAAKCGSETRFCAETGPAARRRAAATTK
jgi:hypothetical protein